MFEKSQFFNFWCIVSTFTKEWKKAWEIFLRFSDDKMVFSIMLKITWDVLFYSKHKVWTIFCPTSTAGTSCGKFSFLWLTLKILILARHMCWNNRATVSSLPLWIKLEHYRTIFDFITIIFNDFEFSCMHFLQNSFSNAPYRQKALILTQL